jgi:hypothetical protein
VRVLPSKRSREKAREHIAKVVRAMEYPHLSRSGERLIMGVMDTADLLRRYEAYGGTGLASYHQTLGSMWNRLRERRHALARAAIRMGESPRTALAYSQLLASPFATEFPNTEIQARRWLRRLEVRETIRTRRAEGR